MAGKKLRIGILTFWWSQDNYGQLLQCYALQKYLRDAGHDAFLIRYNPENDFARTLLWKRILKAFNPVLLFNYLNLKNRKRLCRAEQKQHSRRFDDFRNRYIVQSEKIYRSYSELQESPPEADCYIVGSDQVWNFYGMSLQKCRNLVHAYFLDFGSPETKRMSYAASWSCTSLRLDIAEEIRPLLAKFSYVSVRERSGADWCRKCGCGNASVVPDPTLLLSAENYRNLYRAENGIKKPAQKYLFLYMLNNECDFDVQKVYDFAASRNLEVVYVTGNSRIDWHEKTFATIPEWLSLVDGAEYVVTNSFHCCVFSLIFHKRFGVVALSGRDEGMNARIETLSELFGTKPRWLTDDFSVLDGPVNSAASGGLGAGELLRVLPSEYTGGG